MLVLRPLVNNVESQNFTLRQKGPDEINLGFFGRNRLGTLVGCFLSVAAVILVWCCLYDAPQALL